MLCINFGHLSVDKDTKNFGELLTKMLNKNNQFIIIAKLSIAGSINRMTTPATIANRKEKNVAYRKVFPDGDI